ncbi:septation protein SepH [Dactylosporangium sp. NBC_01737]|uniref:septation protein SepH n=1 Tax=Dactylosporangium sp. NBC_01737 TaxID=2975959 RepID=UPI002E111498|nr:septation protein SepH [Dactylosporangium sp. NBC_01737]
MRPVRFVALSEDGQAFVLADEVGRLLALPIDDRVHSALRPDQSHPTATMETAASQLAPRDIQARIRSGESAEEVARVAGVPVDRVLRYAGPVLQERAMLAQHARRTKLKNSDKGSSLAEVVDARLGQHGIDTEKISWDAYRREDGTWRITATWPSGKATAQAVWELDKARQQVAPHDDMAQYLCTERAPHVLGQEPPAPDRALPSRGETSRGDLGMRPDPLRHGGGGHELIRPSNVQPERRPGGRGLGDRGADRGLLGNDPIRAGRDALLASLDRPLGSSPSSAADEPAPAPAPVSQGENRARGAAALIGRSPFDDDSDQSKEIPAVPSLAVLRPRRNTPSAAGGAADQPTASDKPRKRLPSWDDVLFGGAPSAARETS